MLFLVKPQDFKKLTYVEKNQLYIKLIKQTKAHYLTSFDDLDGFTGVNRQRK